MHFSVMVIYINTFSENATGTEIGEMCKALLLIAGFFIILYLADLALNKDETSLDDGWAILVENQPQKILSRSKIYQTRTKERNLGCHFNSDCFDVYRCGANNNGKLKGNVVNKCPL